jgi:ribonuclease HII
MASSRSQLACSPRESFVCDQTFEQWAVLLGHRRIAGIDEVGRGALFGPVCAAAVTLNLEEVPAGIDDSKKLSPKQREVLAEKIKDTALDFSIAFVEARVIDDINILQATFEAMRRAIQGLRRAPDFLLCDSVILPGCIIPQRSIVKGDARSVSIAAASILAKVERDRLVCRLDAKYPGYDLANNMGYGTEKHLKALSVLGPTDLHRRTFRGVGVDSPLPGC